MSLEHELIEKIKQNVLSDRSVIAGIGDDCAVLKIANDRFSLVTTDTLVEKIHFDCNWHPAELIGRKSASVNISDIAAMAGTPKYALLSLSLPKDFSAEWVDLFMNGFNSVLQQYQIVLIGGDTVGSMGDIVISVTIIGEVNEAEMCLRSGAMPGDAILASGNLGESVAGLFLSEKQNTTQTHQYSKLIEAHLDPKPQVELGRLLGSSGHITAMLDLSDGLATDLAHICRLSGVGAEIIEESLPISSQCHEVAKKFNQDAVQWALSGGEDYQLLFTVKPQNVNDLQNLIADKLAIPLTRIGEIREGSGVVLIRGKERVTIDFQGFDHFG